MHSAPRLLARPPRRERGCEVTGGSLHKAVHLTLLCAGRACGADREQHDTGELCYRLANNTNQAYHLQFVLFKVVPRHAGERTPPRRVASPRLPHSRGYPDHGLLSSCATARAHSRRCPTPPDPLTVTS